MLRLLGRAGIGLFCFLSSLCSGHDYGFNQPSGMAFALAIGYILHCFYGDKEKMFLL